MKIHKAFKYRIYPTAQQERRLLQWEGALRFLWNLAHEQRLMGLARSRDERVYPTAFDQQAELRELRTQLPWLADVPYDAASRMLIRLDQAWRRCFRKLCGRPRWKRRGVDALSICIEDGRKRWLRDNEVFFCKIGLIRAVIHRSTEGRAKSCRIVRDGDQWFAIILCEIEKPEPESRHAPIVAIDRGIVNTLADSSGRIVANPRFYERTLKRLARAQRTVSRRKKGSKNREKAKLRVMRLHRKVRRQREHFLHVESSRYAKSHGVIVIEKLNTAGMIRGNLGRSIADAGWSRFAGMLRYKLVWSGGTLIEVPAAYSSQTCSHCGAVDKRSRLSQSEFCCTGCGCVDHADINAAKVLLSRANRSALPVEGEVPETARRSRKAVKLWTPRRKPQAHLVG